jgi:adenine phosphoribosyltransferase
MPQMLETLKESIRSIPDFPKKGVIFRDITPLLSHREKMRACIDHFVELTKGPVDYVISIESRGFIFGAALAYALGAGFVPIRKEGKLPYKKLSAQYDLEYGKAVMEIHADAIEKGARVVLIDDVLATGGTMAAAINLVQKFEGKIKGIYFLIELTFLPGREKLKGHPVEALIAY